MGRLLLLAALSLHSNSVEGAHLLQSMYAGANMGHPSREERLVLSSHPCDADQLRQCCYPNLLSGP
jgi:hypothetical protein